MASPYQIRGLLSFRRGLSSSNSAYLVTGPTNLETDGKFGLAAAEKVNIDDTQPIVVVSTNLGTLLQFSIAVGTANLSQANFGTFASTGGSDGAHGVIEFSTPTGTFLYEVNDGFGVFTGSTSNFIVLTLQCGPAKRL